MSAAEIADELQVSSRTIHRDLPEIEQLLAPFGITLRRKAGSGMQLVAPPNRLAALKQALRAAETTEFTAEERKVMLLCLLLERSEPVKLFALARELQVAVPTISGDLDELVAWIRQAGLQLVRKRGVGVILTGDEGRKRAAISQLVHDHLDDSALFAASSAPKDRVGRKLMEMVGRDLFYRVEKALWQLDEQMPSALSEQAYTFLLLQLSVALTRSSRGFAIGPDGESGVPISDKAVSLTRRLAAMLELSLPPEEERHVAGLLQEWQRDAPAKGLIHDDLAQFEWVNRLVRAVARSAGYPLEQDNSLKEGLLQHISQVFARIKAGETVKNPLLPQIRRDYASLFATVRAAVDDLSPDLVLPDEEIAFLVMHMVAAMERIDQEALRVRALLVCTSGIGSSKLLAARVKKELPQIDLLAHVSWYEAARFPREAYDLIISTVDLPLPADQYIKLTPLLTKEEVERLAEFVQNLRLSAGLAASGRDDGTPASLAALDRVGAYSRDIVRLIEQFRIYRLALGDAGDGDGTGDGTGDSAGDGRGGDEISLSGVMEQVAAILVRRGQLGEAHVQDLIRLIVERERRGSQLLAGTGLALLHARSDAVDAPLVALFRPDRPFRWTGLPVGERVRQILFMLGPVEMEARTLEVLSEWSAMLLEPGMIPLLEKEDEAAIKGLFSDQFKRYIKTKLGWR